MKNAKVSLVVDLHGRTKEGALQIRDELQSLVRSASGGKFAYGTNYHGKPLKQVGGSLLEIDFSNGVGYADSTWRLFTGLAVVQVVVTEEGTDHFPAAGMYHYASLDRPGNLYGASATVSWSATTEYPAREEFVESIISTNYRDRLVDTKINMPVVAVRTWRLALVAPTVARAERAYELLRGGLWLPRTPFTDSLSDAQKIRQVPVSFEPGDPDQ